MEASIRGTVAIERHESGLELARSGWDAAKSRELMLSSGPFTIASLKASRRQISFWRRKCSTGKPRHRFCANIFCFLERCPLLCRKRPLREGATTDAIHPYHRSGLIPGSTCRASLCGKLQNLNRAIRRYAAWLDSGLPRKRRLTSHRARRAARRHPCCGFRVAGQ